jgi:hypothetical protein
MKMARILIAILVVAMMFNIVGCGKVTQDGVSGKPEMNDVEKNNDLTNKNEETSDVQTEGFVETYYRPETDGLVGIAVYPIDNVETFPYSIGEKVQLSSDWKFVYSVEENVVVYDDNIVGRGAWFASEDEFIVNGSYASIYDSVWGYVYYKNNELYIVATHDLVESDVLNSDAREFHVDGFSMYFDAYKIDQAPDSYKFSYVRYNMKYDEEFKHDIYSVSEPPSEVILPDPVNWNYLRIRTYKDGESLDKIPFHITNLSYNHDIREPGLEELEVVFDGYKGVETYQYVITFIMPQY